MDARIEEARRALAAGRSREAQTKLEAVLREDPYRLDAIPGIVAALRAQGRSAAAVAALGGAADLPSDDPSWLRNLGVTLHRLGQPELAEQTFRRALALAPDSADAHGDLGQAMLMGGRYEEAVASFREAVSRSSGSAAYKTLLGQALIEVERLQEAETWLREAIRDDPANGNAHAALGALLKQIGRFEEASEELEEAVRLLPHRGGPYLEWASGRRVEPSDRPRIEAMERLLADSRLPPDDRRALHYAAGKALDDLGEYGLAMRHFDDANRIARETLRASGRAFDRKALSTRIDGIIRSLPKSRFTGQPAAEDDVPLFIVGMVRSGTTLVEQTLSRHPEIAAGGELPFWTGRAQRILNEQSADRAGIAQMREEYASILRSVSPDAPHVTDKMPGNFVALGPMHLAFPGSRLVVCRRQAIDNALSIYTTAFRTGHAYVHDRDDIVFFIGQFERLMDHWRETLPADRLLEVRYEDVVREQEATTRRVLDFCGLKWEGACLSPEANERPVKTPSQWQVRQPVYTTSVDRWRRYEPWLGSFHRLLE